MTPLLLRKVVYAGSHSSFKQAAEGLEVLAEVSISSQRIRRCTEKIGNERVAQVEQAAASFELISLPDRQKCPEAVTAPQVACVQMDGGRIQIRQRQVTVDDDLSSDASEIEGQDQQEVAERKGKFWRESKVACLLSMVSEKSLTDPHPTIPAIFIDPGRIKRLCSEIKRKSAAESELAKSSEPPDNAFEEALDQMDETVPSIVSRHVIASRENSTTFGAQMAAEAYRLGFNAAPRKAYVCDGQSANWRVWQRWFSHYTPIVDFVHAVCYVYAAAMAGSSVEQGWADYLRWAQWLWNGEVEKIIQELTAKQHLVGEPTAGESKTTTRSIVAESLTYLTNQKSRMHYPEYRREGLPTTSVYVESTIKQINQRVKSTEKFWDRAAAAILQLKADYLSPKSVLANFWAARPSKNQTTRQWHEKPAQTAR